MKVFYISQNDILCIIAKVVSSKTSISQYFRPLQYKTHSRQFTTMYAGLNDGEGRGRSKLPFFKNPYAPFQLFQDEIKSFVAPHIGALLMQTDPFQIPFCNTEAVRTRRQMAVLRPGISVNNANCQRYHCGGRQGISGILRAPSLAHTDLVARMCVLEECFDTMRLKHRTLFSCDIDSFMTNFYLMNSGSHEI